MKKCYRARCAGPFREGLRHRVMVKAVLTATGSLKFPFLIVILYHEKIQFSTFDHLYERKKLNCVKKYEKSAFLFDFLVGFS